MDRQTSNQIDEYNAAAHKVRRALEEIDDLINMRVVEGTALDDLYKVSTFLSILLDKMVAKAERLSTDRRR